MVFNIRLNILEIIMIKKHIINIFFIGSICRLKRPDIFIDVLNILNELSSITFNGYIIGPVLEKSCFEETEKK